MIDINFVKETYTDPKIVQKYQQKNDNFADFE